ncbi:hypothetical protein D0Z03_001306 [Geotrichum reessii]|nr:hypothetical protein D0Z03_001306 [Galactomyces reessii]
MDEHPDKMNPEEEHFEEEHFEEEYFVEEHFEEEHFVEELLEKEHFEEENLEEAPKHNPEKAIKDPDSAQLFPRLDEQKCLQKKVKYDYQVHWWY